MRFTATLLVTLLWVGSAFAHGPTPAASELIALRDRSATLVRITRGGFALRVVDGFQYVCPEAVGGVLAPAATLALGPTLVASDVLYLIAQDGRISPHPVQSGQGIALAARGDAAFGIFLREGQRELRRITASSNELVRAFAEPYEVVAVGADFISMLQWSDDTLQVQTLSWTGDPRSSATWTVTNGIARASLRIDGGQLYVSVWGKASPWATLGRIGVAGYERVREAAVELLGPVNDVLLVDGRLERFGTGEVIASASCLGEVEGTLYACANGGIHRLEAQGLGEPLFALGTMLDPDFSLVSEAMKPNCRARWLDLRTDVAALTMPDADAGITPSDAGSTAEAQVSDGGCTTLPSGQPSLAVLIVLTLYALRRRRNCGRADGTGRVH